MGATSRIQINLKMGIENLDFVEGRTDDLVLFKKKNECVCDNFIEKILASRDFSLSFAFACAIEYGNRGYGWYYLLYSLT